MHLKSLPFSNYEELTRKHGVLKLTNIIENKSIPKLCKLNPISVCQSAGKFRFFHSKNTPSNTYSSPPRCDHCLTRAKRAKWPTFFKNPG